MTDATRPTPSERRRAVRRWRSTYALHFLTALAASLLLILLAVQLPIYETPGRVGWLARPVPEARIQLQVAPREVADRAETRAPQDAPPITTFVDDTRPDGEDEQTARKQDQEQRASETADEPIPITRLMAQDLALRAQNRLPRVKGGMGNLYLGIDYPEAARRQGIEGQLVLEFIVERDGSTSHIEVVQSLHPLCDSSAATALANTQFVPGRWNEAVVSFCEHDAAPQILCPQLLKRYEDGVTSLCHRMVPTSI